MPKKKMVKPLKTWGRHGYEKLERDERGLVVRTSQHFEATMMGRQRGIPREMVFSGGPECHVYDCDSISDEDRERLEREIGAPFTRRRR